MPPGFSGDLSFISSEPSVVTSQSGKRFFVHGDIISDLDLERIFGTNNLDLSAWDDDTVSRWTQFLYVGDYQIPEYVWQEKWEGEEEEDGDEDEDEDEEEKEEGEEEEEEEEEEKEEEEEEEDEEEEEEEEEGGEQALTDRDGLNTPDKCTFQGRANRKARENALLPHAYIYVLAHSLGPDELERVAFDRLSSALYSAGSFIDKGAFKPAIDFIEMLAYTLNLPEAEHYPIRLGQRVLLLVRNFAATHFGNLMSQGEMSSLMLKNCVFAVWLMELVANSVRKAKSVASQLESWRDRARSSEEALQESVWNNEKLQTSIVAKDVDMWMLKKEREVLMSKNPEITLKINEDLLYSQFSRVDIGALRVKLWKLYDLDRELMREFKVAKSQEIRQFLDFDTSIAGYLDSCLEAADKLFRSDWSALENPLELIGKYESSTAAENSSGYSSIEATTGSNLTRSNSIEMEGRPKIIPRPLELEVVKSAHMIHWFKTDSNHGIATLPVKSTTWDALERCLVVRAAWLDRHAEWMRDKIKWFEARFSKDRSAQHPNARSNPRILYTRR
ncbi:uncharacterized protein LAJ45_07442 [Morchella importuna]|uniref:uncharacterized protein n=1 Tax=Morchella importuna TaxID=1174673 RepID=UPI001E8D863A|nr:uncharacterized protein LAJ45_07442 [Morchella importuna]KAH8148341.1 hypothetical protein LAJ45_07442 [Morchella importuna]